MEEKKSNWGGKRAGAGRRPASPDGELRAMHSMRATTKEWEIIKAFAKILKDDRERACRMMETE